MKAAVARLGLGTAQFGLDNGVTNPGGRVPPATVAAILAGAAAAGIDLLDTASLYGDSEATLGRTAQAGAFAIVSKTPKFGDCQSPEAANARLREGLETSLARTGRPSLDALLAHDADDLIGPLGDALWAGMEAARAAGQVGRIGVSVYDGAQIAAVLERFPVEIVQLPWNPLDHRLDEAGQIDRLAGAGVEIHVRSLFLQGLLLQAPEAIAAKFGPVRDKVAELHGWARARGLSPLEGVLACALGRPEFARLIVGVTSTRELAEVVAAADRAQSEPAGVAFEVTDKLDARYLNPSRWAELEGR